MIVNIFVTILLASGVFTPDMSIDFARNLENEGDYFRAITEYKRAYYELPDTGSYSYLKDEVAYSIVKLSEKMDDLETARHFLDRIRDKKTKRYKIQDGLWYFLNKDYREARKRWSFSDTLVAWTYLKEKRFERAEKVFGKINIPYRSSFIAAMLSAVVPGLGKVYAGRTYDGIYSFILNAGSFYLAYDACKNRRKPELYLYSGIFLFFYTGNVYGSFISARDFNDYHVKFAITEKEISLGLWRLLP